MPARPPQNTMETYSLSGACVHSGPRARWACTPAVLSVVACHHSTLLPVSLQSRALAGHQSLTAVADMRRGHRCGSHHPSMPSAEHPHARNPRSAPTSTQRGLSNDPMNTVPARPVCCLFVRFRPWRMHVRVHARSKCVEIPCMCADERGARRGRTSGHD